MKQTGQLERAGDKVGRLLFIAAERPDITYGVKELAKRVHSPTEEDAKACKRVVRYLRTVPKLVIKYEAHCGAGRG